MNNHILSLEKIISDYAPSLKQLKENIASQRTDAGKWSKKEIIGHLIDSAQNNIRRFIVAQYEDKPLVVYAQDHWVTAADYQNYPLPDLIYLWVLLNKHMIRILQNIPPEMQEKEVHSEELHSIEWLAADYIPHLLHHLHQVLDMEEVPYP
jgi:hypothetical protein